MGKRLAERGVAPEAIVDRVQRSKKSMGGWPPRIDAISTGMPASRKTSSGCVSSTMAKPVGSPLSPRIGWLVTTHKTGLMVAVMQVLLMS